jgi:hypothetical protein
MQIATLDPLAVARLVVGTVEESEVVDDVMAYFKLSKSSMGAQQNFNDRGSMISPLTHGVMQLDVEQQTAQITALLPRPDGTMADVRGAADWERELSHRLTLAPTACRLSDRDPPRAVRALGEYAMTSSVLLKLHQLWVMTREQLRYQAHTHVDGTKGPERAPHPHPVEQTLLAYSNPAMAYVDLQPLGEGAISTTRREVKLDTDKDKLRRKMTKVKAELLTTYTPCPKP